MSEELKLSGKPEIGASYAAAWRELNQRLKIRHDSAVQFAAYCLIPILTAVWAGMPAKDPLVPAWVVATAFLLMPAIGACLLVTSYCHNDWRIGTLNRFCALCEEFIPTLSWHSLSEAETHRYGVRQLPPFSPLCRFGFLIIFLTTTCFCWFMAGTVSHRECPPSIVAWVAYLAAWIISILTSSFAVYLLILTHGLRSRLVGDGMKFGIKRCRSSIMTDATALTTASATTLYRNDWILAHPGTKSMQDTPFFLFRWVSSRYWEFILSADASLQADCWIITCENDANAEQSDRRDAVATSSQVVESRARRP